MKRYFLGVLGLALLGGAPAMGQTPGAVPAGHMVGGYDACCPSTHAVCVPECYVKETKKWVYSSGCEPLCLCYFRGLFGGHCGECENGRCEHPYTVKYLVKKPRVCTANATKCVPSEAPCDGGRPGLFRHGAAPMPATPSINAQPYSACTESGPRT